MFLIFSVQGCHISGNQGKKNSQEKVSEKQNFGQKSRKNCPVAFYFARNVFSRKIF